MHHGVADRPEQRSDEPALTTTDRNRTCAAALVGVSGRMMIRGLLITSRAFIPSDSPVAPQDDAAAFGRTTATGQPALCTNALLTEPRTSPANSP